MKNSKKLKIVRKRLEHSDNTIKGWRNYNAQLRTYAIQLATEHEAEADELRAECTALWFAYECEKEIADAWAENCDAVTETATRQVARVEEENARLEADNRRLDEQLTATRRRRLGW